MEIVVGTEYTEETVVNEANMASAIGSGLVDVFATPMMVALLELAASNCIAKFLQPGQVSVGTHIDVSHSDATPLGMKVWATARVTAVDRRRVDFSVAIRDEKGEVGSGTHTRFVVDREKFQQKTLEKLG